MKTTLRLTLIAISLMALAAFAVGQGRGKGVVPAAGFVPDEATAIRVAEAILIPIHGQKQVESERPFSAKLAGNVWKVEGYLPPDADGGVAEVSIDRRDGRILRVYHGL